MSKNRSKEKELFSAKNKLSLLRDVIGLRSAEHLSASSMGQMHGGRAAQAEVCIGTYSTTETG